MGTTLLKIKLMPSSPDVDLEEIKAKAKEVLGSLVSAIEKQGSPFDKKGFFTDFAQKNNLKSNGFQFAEDGFVTSYCAARD